MQDAQARHRVVDDQAVASIDWCMIGSQVRRFATIATVEHLEQQRVSLAGGMVSRIGHPCGSYASHSGEGSEQ